MTHSDSLLRTPTASLISKPASYFPALTGLRAVAAYLVYLHHFNPFQTHSLESNTLGYFCFAICRELHIGVTIFFCLSGFLIGHRYLNKVELTGKWAFNYFRNRFARIYPAYFLLTVVTFLFCLHSPGSIYAGPYNVFTSTRETLLIFGLNASFLRGFSDTIKFTGVAQGWSLTVEETFYFCAPVILLLLSKSKRWLLLFLLIYPTLGIFSVLLFKHRPTLGTMDNYVFMWSYTFFGRCFEFLSGMLLAALLQTLAGKKLQSVFTWLGAILIGACIIMLASVSDYSADLPGGVFVYKKIFINNLLLALAVIIFFYGLLMENTWLRALLSSSPLQLLGKSSYIFYLIHVGFIEVWAKNDLHLSSVSKFILLNLIAIALYKFFEEPINGFLRKRLIYKRY